MPRPVRHSFLRETKPIQSVKGGRQPGTEGGVNRRKVLSVRQEPRRRMLGGEAEEVVGMRPWRAPCASVRGLFGFGDGVTL